MRFVQWHENCVTTNSVNIATARILHVLNKYNNLFYMEFKTNKY